MSCFPSGEVWVGVSSGRALYVRLMDEDVILQALARRRRILSRA